MKVFSSRFKAKFIAIAVSLLTIIVFLAGAFYLSIDRYNYHFERSKLAQSVLSSYLAVSNHTYRKLNVMAEIVNRGEIDDMDARFANEKLLLEALDRVRGNIISEVTNVHDEDESDELSHLADIERISEIIIQGSANIRLAIRAGDLQKAQNELSVLRSEAVIGKFSNLIDEALEEEYREVVETEAEASRLGDIIKTLLPVSIALILIPGLFFVMLVSRHLSSSIMALEHAARAYTSGDLSHRTKLLPEKEFSNLGLAFNQMAQELSMRREAAEKSQQSLETLVQERTEELEALNSRLAKLDIGRRQLLADISHELRTPLTVIQGESEMALRGAPKSTEEYQQALNRVREQVLHTSGLVDDLLFVARAEDGKARINKRSVAVATVLRAVCRDFQSIASDKSVQIEDSYDDQQVVIFGDEGRLRQVFSILIDNAIRYSHNKGIVSVNLSVSQANATAELSVRDRGIGLTEDEASQVFQRFYRGANAERHAQGTGLGLPVAKAIIEAHDGQIFLTGKPGKGAMAIVRLPLENRLRAIV